MTRIDALPQLWQITDGTNGYLLVRGSRSLLIDCPSDTFAEELAAAGLPSPDTILHTQVQEEHCREWSAFPDAQVYVFAESIDVATRAEQFFKEIETEWPPSREWEARGEEKYGVAGCTTERLPEQPLRVAGTLQPGQVFQWEGIDLEVVALPGSGKRAIGFYWRQENVLFSGDLLQNGGYLVNVYDLERSYGGPGGFAELRASLTAVQELKPSLLLPTTGSLITDPMHDSTMLLQRIAWVWKAPARRTDEPYAITNYPPLREFGRYREVIPGVYQNNNYGNIILFVNAAGDGLMIDPDPCVWLSWEENCREIHADLDLLERETGLKRIELAMPTHYHGDHVQYCDLLRERYNTEILATPDVAALMERPQDFPHPCLVDWYGFPFKQIQVDRRIAYDVPFDWHGVAVTPVHTPGHCLAHTGYLLRWQGVRIVCGGDTVQYGQGPIQMGLPCIYNDTAWPDRSPLVTYRWLAQVRPDLVLGGHSHSFFDHDGSIVRDFCAAAEESVRLAAAMVPEGELLRAMTPVHYDTLRPASVACC
ncbi:MAG: MBL fold metallo-hydrolase [Armatimonadota bacterium]